MNEASSPPLASSLRAESADRRHRPQVVIIADDLTGAADAAGYFATIGLTCVVQIEPGQCPDADVAAVSTNSRDLAEDAAVLAARTAAWAVRQLGRRSGPRWVFKKIDSTLRGHPGAELAAVMAELGKSRALVAPAFPEQGRTTVHGMQLIDGSPLGPTAQYAEAPSADLVRVFQPHLQGYRVDQCSLADVLAGPSRIAELLATDGPCVLIGDATSMDHLEALVRGATVSGVRTLCGSAGLARAMGAVLPIRPSVGLRAEARSDAGSILVVAGSRNPATEAQVAAAARRGVEIVPVRGSESPGATEIPAEAVRQAEIRLAHGRDVVLTSGSAVGPAADRRGVAEWLAAIACDFAGRFSLGGLVLTGGDTALAVLRALGSGTICLHGEVEPGIPWGALCDGPRCGLPLVTKAGGFGGPTALLHSIDLLRSWGERCRADLDAITIAGEPPG